MSIQQTRNKIQNQRESKADIQPIHIVTLATPKLRVQMVFPSEENRTKQEFKDECDINNLMSKYLKTGVLDWVNKNEPKYGEISGLDFRQAQELIAEGATMFHELPASIRDTFQNDPSEFLEFASNPANKQEMAAMGLLSPAAMQALSEATTVQRESEDRANPPQNVPQSTKPPKNPGTGRSSPPEGGEGAGGN